MIPDPLNKHKIFVFIYYYIVFNLFSIIYTLLYLYVWYYIIIYIYKTSRIHNTGNTVAKRYNVPTYSTYTTKIIVLYYYVIHDIPIRELKRVGTYKNINNIYSDYV